MKYLTYLMSLLLVLAFVGCDKAKEADVIVPETTTEAVEDAVEAVEAVDVTVDEATEILEEVTE